jgi:hypothetical protein
MKIALISRLVVMPVVLCTLSAAPMMARAQDNGVDGPPKVLVVVREMTKPGREGMMHAKTEGEFAQLARANHVDFHYFAMTSLSGQNRALFFSGYGSMAEWEAVSRKMGMSSAGAAMDRANVADGDQLLESGQSVWIHEPELSMNEHDLKGERYMQISQYFVKPGHVAEWKEMVKLLKEGYAKGVPEASWAMFEQRYGPGGNVYLVVTAMKSLGDVDGMLGSGKALMDALGESGMKKRAELQAECVASWQMNLFAINPGMSNPPEQWVKDEPEFWAPKKMTPMKKEEKKKPM